MPPVLDDDLRRLFGEPSDPPLRIADRARFIFPDRPVIVWEGDPQTFQFSYVSDDARVVLGYAVDRWITEPTFWADIVVHRDDRDDAIAYCALATAKGADHVFEYRAIASNGDLVWLRDYVHVVRGPKGIPLKLRGVMFDVSLEKRDSVSPMNPRPSRDELIAS